MVRVGPSSPTTNRLNKSSCLSVSCIYLCVVYVLFADTNEVLLPEIDGHIPAFPEPEASILKEAFRRALGKVPAPPPPLENGGSVLPNSAN